MQRLHQSILTSDSWVEQYHVQYEDILGHVPCTYIDAYGICYNISFSDNGDKLAKNAMANVVV